MCMHVKVPYEMAWESFNISYVIAVGLILRFAWVLCRLRSIAHSVCCLSVRSSLCLSGSHTFLVVTHSYVKHATHAFLGIQPLFSSHR